MAPQHTRHTTICPRKKKTDKALPSENLRKLTISRFSRLLPRALASRVGLCSDCLTQTPISDFLMVMGRTRSWDHPRLTIKIDADVDPRLKRPTAGNSPDLVVEATAGVEETRPYAWQSLQVQLGSSVQPRDGFWPLTVHSDTMAFDVLQIANVCANNPSLMQRPIVVAPDGTIAVTVSLAANSM